MSEMGKAQRVTLDATGTTIEYVRRRGILRFATSGRDGTAEVAPGALLRDLGIDVADLAPTRQFLLFGGRGPATAGGLGDLIAVVGSESEARDEFRRLWLGDSPHGWAELAALDAAGRLRRICWYGEKNGPPAPTAPTPVPSWRRRPLFGRVVTESPVTILRAAAVAGAAVLLLVGAASPVR